MDTGYVDERAGKNASLKTGVRSSYTVGNVTEQLPVILPLSNSALRLPRVVSPVGEVVLVLTLRWWGFSESYSSVRYTTGNLLRSS